MAFCTKCGKKIPEEANFCPNCGARTVKGEEDDVAYPRDEVREAFSKMADELEKAFDTASKEIQRAFKTVSDSISEPKTRASVTCPNCGAKTAGGSIFCSSCGKKLSKR